MSKRHGLPSAIATLPPLAVTLTLLSAAGFSHAAQGQPQAQLELERTIALPGVTGRIDHLAVDVPHRRLFVAELGNGSVDAVDLSSGATRRIGGLREPQVALTTVQKSAEGVVGRSGVRRPERSPMRG